VSGFVKPPRRRLTLGRDAVIVAVSVSEHLTEWS
jgi:hypothetical protein